MLRPGELVVLRATPQAAGVSSSRLARDLDSCLQRTDPSGEHGGRRR